MSWNKYKVQKKQIYVSGSGWQDATPLETRQGDLIESYSSYTDCFGDDVKIGIYWGTDYEAVSCDADYYGDTNTEISKDAFRETSKGYSSYYLADTIMIGNCVTSIRNYGFQNLRSLKSVYLPSTITSIGNAAFEDCRMLTSVTIPDSVTSIGERAFWGCSGLTDVILPSGITNIDKLTFENCSGLTSITIPSGVTSIGNQSFHNCSSLPSITIPDRVRSIGNWAFQNCSGLTSVTIGSGITSIAQGAFILCYGLQDFIITAPSPPTLGSGALDGSTCYIRVPYASVNAYKTASGWSTYASRIRSI